MLLVAVMLTAIGVTSIPQTTVVASARRRPHKATKSKKKKKVKAKTITIKKADKKTAKKVHTALNKGKAVNFKVKGSKKSASKLWDKVEVQVGKYNKYAVVPQDAGSVKSKKGYRLYKIDSYNAKLYKYGLALVKDIIKSDKVPSGKNSPYAYDRWLYNEWVKDELEPYNEGGKEYKRIFEEVTGMSYDTYKGTTTGQIYKGAITPKTTTLEVRYNGVLDDRYNNFGYNNELKNWYYGEYTDKNGKKVYFSDILSPVIDGDLDGISTCEDKLPAVKPHDYKNYYLDSERVKMSDITFHYEPPKIDFNKVNQVVKVAKDKVVAEVDAMYEAIDKSNPLRNKDFCDFSQATRLYYVCKPFQGGPWCDYNRASTGNGLTGVKAMLKHKWKGVCGDYASMECTMYRLMGIKEKDYQFIADYKLNHGWTIVKLTNGEGKTAWCVNNYGLYEGHTYKSKAYAQKENRNTEEAQKGAIEHFFLLDL